MGDWLAFVGVIDENDIGKDGEISEMFSFKTNGKIYTVYYIELPTATELIKFLAEVLGKRIFEG